MNYPNGHCELRKFSNASLATAISAANVSIQVSEDAATDTQTVEVANTNVYWDGSNHNIILTVKTIDFTPPVTGPEI